MQCCQCHLATLVFYVTILNSFLPSSKMNLLPRTQTTIRIGLKCATTMRNLSSDAIFDNMIDRLGEKYLKRSKITSDRVNKFKISKTVVPKIRSTPMEDTDVDSKIKTLLAEDGASRAVTEMWDISIIDGKFPTKKTMLLLCASLASEGNFCKINTVAHLCKIAFPEEHLARVGYEHYVAEAYWKIGRYSDAIQLFQELFGKHEHIRHKVANMSRFLILKILADRIDDMYPLLLQFARACVNRGHFTVATNLWRHSFESEHYEVQQLCESLLQEFPQLLNHIRKKLVGIMAHAQDDGNIGLFQRLIRFALTQNLYEDQKTIFSVYMEYLCDLEDVGRAVTTFNYICQYEIQLPATTVQKFTLMMTRKKQKVPFVLVGNESNPNKQFKFHF